MWLIYNINTGGYVWRFWYKKFNMILDGYNNPCKHLRMNSSAEYIHHIFQKVNKCG